MKKEALAALLALLVIVAAAAAVYSEFDHGTSSNVTTSSTRTSPAPTNCTTTFPGGLALRGSGNQTRLFTMLPGGTGLVCVTYTVDTGTMSAASSTVQFSSTVDIVHVTYADNSNGAGGVYSYSYQTATGIEESADPSTVNLQRGSGNTTTVTVVYTITASPNSTGFYSLGFTSCSTPIPFAVTDDWQEVGPSDFGGFFRSAGCVYQPPISGLAVTGLADMNTSLLVGQ